jgi:2'-5' RNA ligase
MKNSLSTIRCFIAIELSDEARTQLARLQNRLEDIFPTDVVRWTAPQNIHLTLHFLGEVPVDQLEPVKGAVLDVAATTPPFSLTLGHLGCFPNTRRPRIVWVDVSGETEILLRLQEELGTRLQKGIAFQPDTRPYSPHLTIGRIRKGVHQQRLRQLGQLLPQEIPKTRTLANVNVNAIAFIRSDLKPGGPLYTRLAQGRLIG